MESLPSIVNRTEAVRVCTELQTSILSITEAVVSMYGIMPTINYYIL